ncbi:MAG: CHAT domain-containing protein [Spirulina sp. SIO3F2]|nr:CHAT domain-containing protein [Spirulina sp. SIO3F2]
MRNFNHPKAGILPINSLSSQFLRSAIAILILIGSLSPVRLEAQTGNQSDVTGPNPTETVPNSEAQISERIDRAGYETLVSQANTETAIAVVEEFHAWEFCNQLQLDRCGQVPSLAEITQTLAYTWGQTGQRPALIYFVALEDELQSFVVMPSQPTNAAKVTNKQTAIAPVVLRQSNPTVDRRELLQLTRRFRRQLNSPHRQGYTETSQKLYDRLLEPIASELDQAGVDVLVLVPDRGLRLMPFSALQNQAGQFLIEQYAVSLIPSFGLSDLQVADLRNRNILAMGAATFTDQQNLPAVPTELAQVVRSPWQGEVLLEQAFTVHNLRDRLASGQFGIVHLATHGVFKGGDLANSYIQFSDRRLSLLEWRDLVTQLNWNNSNAAQLEMWVLSACETAVGSVEAELGFAGLAVQLSAKSALASFWQVSDAGTLALMSEFYRQLQANPLKAQALRQTQLAMLRGEVRVDNNALVLPDGSRVAIAAAATGRANLDFSHPYYWSGFTNIGSWN